ncbi:MAG TPA: MarR family winged helix-turn-helix transcriptional regulator [Pedococcus sp.]|jgi:DNA-binding MarR family transcriptional regulator|nr:MarR family winged helix-turn-helix transcriptional regulator [Pedococcus sp.]
MSPTSLLGELDVELTRMLWWARSAQKRTAIDAHPDLDNAGYAVLVAIRELSAAGGGVRGAELADALGLHKSTISRNLSTLEDLGLVERILDPTDARARQVRLTGGGIAALDRTFEGRLERLRSQLSAWDAADIGELATLLRRFNDTPLP